MCPRWGAGMLWVFRREGDGKVEERRMGGRGERNGMGRVKTCGCWVGERVGSRGGRMVGNGEAGGLFGLVSSMYTTRFCARTA